MGLLVPVYVIDDDSGMLESTQFLLSSFNIESKAFSDPLAFLQAVAGLEPGCVLSDLRMPSMTGLELHRALSARGVDWPMVLMSGNSDLETNRHLMDDGIVGFLEKPFAIPELLDALKSASRELERKPG